MPGEFMPPEPGPAGPPREPEAAGPPEPSPPTVPAPAAATADAGPPAEVPDPAAVTGPPWPRLVAADGAYTPPRLARWPIVVGILLFAGWVAALVVIPAVSSSNSGYA